MTDKINIEIDGKKMFAEQGSMIIEAADNHDVYIPRFCYHKKLSVAANCRMCLVEIEGGRKAIPACATPVTAGMKVKTKSALARKSQKAVMEFLLINHPLDCPVCDQGGQCDLQDLSIGYGSDASRYDGPKHVVKDKDLGPLIKTHMTRCINCTRCVRFGKEIAGEPELGTIGRGGETEIGTYIEKAVRSELSGNIIDICPVGALTSKPFRFSARAWELKQFPSIAAHDCLGSNINIHVDGKMVKRVVPRENDSVNDVWLSDRDRFSYVGVNSEQRITKPMLKKDGQWQTIDWTTALEIVASSLENIKATYGANELSALISPNSAVEEHYLLQKLVRQFGSNNIDHRIKQVDFNDQDGLPVTPRLGISIENIDNLDAALFVGADVQREQPLLITRLLKASRRGGTIMSAHMYDVNAHFMSDIKLVAAPERLIQHLAAIVKTLSDGNEISEQLKKLLADVTVTENERKIAEYLQQGHTTAVILGAIAQNSQYASTIRYLSSMIAELSGATYGILSQGANSVGACLAGSLPHRSTAGVSTEKGQTAKDVIDSPKKAYVLYNVEPELDFANAAKSLSALKSADFVVSLSPFVTDTMKSYADIILPIAPFTEADGTFVNCNGVWQSFCAATQPLGESRPGWKVLRVLGNFFDYADFNYTSAPDVCAEVKLACANVADFTPEINFVAETLAEPNGLQRIGVWPLYRSDNIVRRSGPLQETIHSSEFGVRINQATADTLNVSKDEVVDVVQEGITTELPVIIDSRASNNCVYIAAGFPEGEQLGVANGAIEIRKRG